MTKLGARNAVLLAGALLFAIGAFDLVLDRGALSLADRIAASLGLVLMALSAAIDPAEAA
jgi:hypothetical protein